MHRLDYLAELGITAIELMPVADFPGGRNWGYDGVLPYAPDSRYGRPEDLKALVQAAHSARPDGPARCGLQPLRAGGELSPPLRQAVLYQKHHTPWGAAINFDGPGSRSARVFHP